MIPEYRTPSQSDPSDDERALRCCNILCTLSGSRRAKGRAERTKDQPAHNSPGHARISPGPQCVDRGRRNPQRLGIC
jgi:hypothetical protein